MKRALPLLLLSACLVTVATACSKDGGDSKATATATTAFGTPQNPANPLPTGTTADITAVLLGGDFYVGENQFAVGLLNNKDELQGGATVTVTFYDLSDPRNPKPLETLATVQSAPGVGPVKTVVHANGESHTHGGEDDNRVGYFVPYNFPHAGTWGVNVEATLKDGTKGQSDFGFPVREKATMPQPGDKAVASDNLTKKDVADIREIDSGSPPNDMHDVKIKDAIAAGRPLVVVFSTPAFCTTRFCGPVNDEVETMQQLYKDKVDFVHIEIWSSFEKQQYNPTVVDWGITADPIVYVVDKDGVIYDRFMGSPAQNILEPAVKAVAAGEVYKP